LKIVGKYANDPEYFAILDRPRFSMLEGDDRHCAYLIDTRSSSRDAQRIRDHRVFSEKSPEKAPVRLFVPQDAKDDVAVLIRDAVGE
jgi:hypothetical protein